MSKSNKRWPSWMEHSPEPEEETRWFSGMEIKGWKGSVPLEQIRYWVGNRRTDSQVARLQRENNEVPNDDLLYDRFEKDPDLAIESLARNIIQNGLRERVVLSGDKKLLDGNRRYLAHRWIAKHGKPQERQKFSIVPVWVLRDEYSKPEFVSRVIAEYNLLDDFKKEWSDYVKAKFLHEEYNSNKGYTLKDLVTLYGGPGFGYGKIVEFIRTYDVMMDFVNCSPDQDSALDLAHKNFIWFQQLWRSYRGEISNDEEFQSTVFDNIRNDRIGKTDHLKNLKDLRKYKEAWTLFKQGEVKEAHVKFESLKLDDEKNPDPDTILLSINSQIERLLDSEGMIDRVSEKNRALFHELALRVPGQGGDVNTRVTYITKNLEHLSSAELASLPKKALTGLELALERVIQQASATQK